MDYRELDDICKVCLCLGISLGDIRDEIKEGATTLEEIIVETQAGTKCSLCKIDDLDLENKRELYLDKILESEKEV